jgi:hypothetical protein
MIIWINGTFGSGKTTTAYELQKRVVNSSVYDPERFGYVLMANIPRDIAKEDFQDYPLWREANYSLLKQISETYNGIIIVPMTLSNEYYFNEIIGKLRDNGIDVKHFTLTASKTTIQKRLRQRLEGKNSWAHQQIDERVSSLSKNTFEDHLPSDSMSIDEVVETIANKSGITLLPDHRTKIKKSIDRMLIQIKEKRLFK